MENSNIKTEILYGFHPVLEALKAKKRVIHKLFVTGPNFSNRERYILTLAKTLGINYEIVGNTKIRSISKSDCHKGLSALVSPLPIFSIRELISKNIFSSSSCFFVMLDGILDPHNLGAIVRTAYCVGAAGVIITRNRACFPTPTVSKVSAGALEHIPLCLVANLSNAIKKFQKEGLWVAGMSATEGTSSIFDTDMSGRIAVVIGSENKGLRPLVRRQCDFLVSVPMAGQLDSLNASVAAAVVLYEIFRQRLA